MRKTIAISACVAAALSTVTPVIAQDVDAIGVPQMTAIYVAYDDVLRDPEQDPDRLSPTRLALIYAAFDVWDGQNVDRLSPARWDAMQHAYRTHGPKGVQFAGQIVE